jgi:RHS repeat-associated protein
MGLPDYDEDYSLEDDPLWNRSVVSPPVDVLTWYQCDHLGTPLELTDQNGEVVWSAQYRAWGEIREERSQWAKQQGIANPIRFQGQYHDHETGLHYNRYRYYDPSVGRFISQDPIGYEGGLNLYQYVPNPIGWTDPRGLARQKGITPNNKGTRTTIESGNLQAPEVGYSAKAGGEGIQHPVVQELYESIPDDQRSPFIHGHCGEADALSKIAKANDVKSVEALRDITQGATSTTVRNDGKQLKFCRSCAQVMGKLGVCDGVKE